jgi:ferritin-like metal-binding protein YciE
MASKTFHELFLDELRDLYSAENQITRALPKLIKAASNAELGQALRSHLEETRQQVERLERIFDGLGESPKGKKCKGMEGLLEEGDEHVKEIPSGSCRDAVIIAAAQRVEHYEISGYGTARAWAEEMGHGEAVSLLRRTLDEEAAADEKLTSIAMGGVLGEGVNEEAEEGGGERSRTKSAAKKKASGKKGGKRGNKAGKKSSKKKAGKKKAGRKGT